MNIKQQTRCVLIAVLVTLLTSLQSYAQDTLAIPVQALSSDSVSHKITMSLVVKTDSLSKGDIYSRINDWYIFKRGNIVGAPVKGQEKNVSGKLINVIYWNADSNDPDSLIKNRQKLIYKIQLYNKDELYSIGTFGQEHISHGWMSGYEYIDLIILIKNGKYKIEATDFIHYMDGDANTNDVVKNKGGSWVYEDGTENTMVRDKKWVEFRLSTMTEMAKIINELIGYVQKPSKTSMDF